MRRLTAPPVALVEGTNAEQRERAERRARQRREGEAMVWSKRVRWRLDDRSARSDPRSD